jgi:protein involved in sex pheromone biosynthesis
MARKIPTHVVWNGSTNDVDTFTSKRAQLKAYYPQYGDLIGRIVWEKPERKRVKR